MLLLKTTKNFRELALWRAAPFLFTEIFEIGRAHV